MYSKTRTLGRRRLLLEWMTIKMVRRMREKDQQDATQIEVDGKQTDTRLDFRNLYNLRGRKYPKGEVVQPLD